jgi:hypothetical protein
LKKIKTFIKPANMTDSQPQTQSPLDKLKMKNISKSTFNLFKKNLLKLNNKEIKNLNFLKNIEKNISKISHLKPNTRRTYIISIVSLLKQEPSQKNLYDKYYKILIGYNNELKVNNSKSASQEENWMTSEAVKETFEKLEKEIEPLLSNKKLTETEYNAIQSFVILSLYVLNPPRRNMDYQLMKIVPKYVEGMSLARNYLDTDARQFVFNNYKTARTYQTQKVGIPDKLFEIINAYLKFHPLKKELMKKKYDVDFLVTMDGQPFKSPNAMTRVLNKVFNRKLGCSMLRHIYLSDKYGEESKDMKQDAIDMGTSIPTIQNQYIKE